MPDTKETFNSIYKNYDFINQLISFGLHKKWKSNFIKLIDFYGETIDIATGTGDIALKIKNMFPLVNVTGYDPSEKMLQIAKRKDKKNEIRFIEGFCENMPFDDSCFNFATITFGIRNTKSLNQSLSEIRRILKKDGILMIMEFSKTDNPLVKNIYHIYLNYIIPFIGSLFGKYHEYKYLATSIDAFYTMNEMNVILESKGFDIIRNIQYNFGLVTVYVVKLKP
jgi:demethylmenaquinone methyltransferase/2-methoxy-6-polyprenyl-1,4-benzoquinol methylase